MDEESDEDQEEINHGGKSHQEDKARQRDEPRIEIETRKVLGNGVPSPNAQWKLQTVCCSEVVTLLMPLNITLVLMLPGLVPRDLYA